ncbi:DEAD/DEAH box helicase [Tumebacillus permanentifrigoris]|uniref:ATP-dependent Lhr-like helicase n=1 Tax=Tumebacillus permanentifrigoris TaxID=378543 RepID=A0A316DBC5_9BACL|nr:DEAD/DEAH box helicase [Tumebacillus permanentifrigoris]PWK14886.1 ATP-dependent Lhr-like helicase [Tumebacillus permanentifrigoris]
MTFSLLSPTIQKKVWDMGWRNFTPIQEASIPAITDKRPCILMAGTASGKTEAAFLPILSVLEREGVQGLKVLYLSPLRALINDQFERIEQLTDTLDIPLIKWHSDVSRSKKMTWLANPRGILQITPESLEALLVNQTDRISDLLREVEFIVIDELHAFLEGDRGLQVQSLLARMRRYMRHTPVMIGLSATIGAPEVAQAFLHPEQPEAVEVINPGDGKRQIFLQVEFFAKVNGTFPSTLVQDLYDLTKDKKSILFCNSRGQVEELTHRLNETGRSVGGPSYVQKFYPHHSSLDKAEREWVEEQMKNTRQPLAVVSTNTLELGIDIGSLDLVVQVDATQSVSSLKQRLGRSGRREGTDSYLMMYATVDEDLVQAVAVTELLFEKWIEPAIPRRATYDLLFHQVLSLCTERRGIFRDELLTEIGDNPTFAHLPIARVRELLEWMLAEDWMEIVEGKCIPGTNGEKLVRSRDFYAVFQSPALYKVLHGNRQVGSIEANPLVMVGESLLLGGATWTITTLDEKRGVVYVEPAFDGKKPIWLSGSRYIHSEIADRMYAVYTSEQDLDYLSPRAWHRLKEVRHIATMLGWTAGARIIQEGSRTLTFYDFAGTRRQNAMATLLRGWLREQDLTLTVKQSAFSVALEGGEIEKGLGKRALNFLVDTLHRGDEERYLLMGRGVEPEKSPPTKFAGYLPKNFQLWIEDEIERDLEGLRKWLQVQKWKILR